MYYTLYFYAYKSGNSPTGAFKHQQEGKSMTNTCYYKL